MDDIRREGGSALTSSVSKIMAAEAFESQVFVVALRWSVSLLSTIIATKLGRLLSEWVLILVATSDSWCPAKEMCWSNWYVSGLETFMCAFIKSSIRHAAGCLKTFSYVIIFCLSSFGCVASCKNSFLTAVPGSPEITYSIVEGWSRLTEAANLIRVIKPNERISWRRPHLSELLVYRPTDYLLVYQIHWSIADAIVRGNNSAVPCRAFIQKISLYLIEPYHLSIILDCLQKSLTAWKMVVPNQKNPKR